jgi:hypothetical protein
VIKHVRLIGNDGEMKSITFEQCTLDRTVRVGASMNFSTIFFLEAESTLVGEVLPMHFSTNDMCASGNWSVAAV